MDLTNAKLAQIIEYILTYPLFYVYKTIDKKPKILHYLVVKRSSQFTRKST